MNEEIMKLINKSEHALEVAEKLISDILSSPAGKKMKGFRQD